MVHIRISYNMCIVATYMYMYIHRLVEREGMEGWLGREGRREGREGEG